jgi:hypothetical protein
MMKKMSKFLLWSFAVLCLLQPMVFASEEEFPEAEGIHNLLWVYADTRMDEERHLSPEGVMFDRAEEWAELNPQYTICMNYDGAFVSKAALGSTRERILLSKYKDQIQLRDTRALLSVKENPSAFVKQRSMECRVDFLRAAKSRQDLVDGACTYSSYSDIDVKPCALVAIMKEKEEDLRNYGMVMAKEERHHKSGYPLRWENGFHIFYADPDFLKCLNQVLIQPTLFRLRLLSHIEGLDEEFSEAPLAKKLEVLMHIPNLKKAFNLGALDDKEYVYTRYEKVLAALHNRKGRGLSCIAFLEGWPQIFLDFKTGVVRAVDHEAKRLRPLSVEYTLEFFLSNPAAEFLVLPLKGKGTIKLMDDNGKSIYVPTTSSLEFPPSKILSEEG